MPRILTLELHRRAQVQLGQRIRELRIERRLTQPALASRCNLHYSHLSKIERGQTNLSLSCLLSIATAFNMTISHLLADIPYPHAATQVQPSAPPSTTSLDPAPSPPQADDNLATYERHN